MTYFLTLDVFNKLEINQVFNLNSGFFLGSLVEYSIKYTNQENKEETTNIALDSLSSFAISFSTQYLVPPIYTMLTFNIWNIIAKKNKFTTTKIITNGAVNIASALLGDAAHKTETYKKYPFLIDASIGFFAAASPKLLEIAYEKMIAGETNHID